MWISLRVLHLHGTEREGRIKLQFVAAFEKGRFPLSETLKIAKPIFWRNFRKIAISKTKTSKAWSFYIYVHIYRILEMSYRIMLGISCSRPVNITKYGSQICWKCNSKKLCWWNLELANTRISPHALLLGCYCSKVWKKLMNLKDWINILDAKLK